MGLQYVYVGLWLLDEALSRRKRFSTTQKGEVDHPISDSWRGVSMPDSLRAWSDKSKFSGYKASRTSI
jgi:hypothetical protein